MSTPRPEPPYDYPTWLDKALGVSLAASSMREYAKAELAELRKERDELREAILRYREASDAYNQQYVDSQDIQLALAMTDARNALFAKLRAEVKP